MHPAPMKRQQVIMSRAIEGVSLRKKDRILKSSITTVKSSIETVKSGITTVKSGIDLYWNCLALNKTGHIYSHSYKRSQYIWRNN
jgi:hypothetical protein